MWKVLEMGNQLKVIIDYCFRIRRIKLTNYLSIINLNQIKKDGRYSCESGNLLYTYEFLHTPSPGHSELHMPRKIGKETVYCWQLVSVQTNKITFKRTDNMYINCIENFNYSSSMLNIGEKLISYQHRKV